MKVYTIIEDDNGNLHQAHIDESKAIIISNLVECYPNGNFTEPLVETIKKLNVNIKKVEDRKLLHEVQCNLPNEHCTILQDTKVV